MNWKNLNWRSIVKYFLHGIPFSLISINLPTLWAYGWILLQFAGAEAGTIIGIIILLLVMGGLNTFVARFLWFRMRRSILRLLLQGLLLTLFLIVTNFLLVTLPQIFIPGQDTTFASLAVSFYFDGYLCKNIAGAFRVEED